MPAVASAQSSQAWGAMLLPVQAGPRSHERPMPDQDWARISNRTGQTGSFDRLLARAQSCGRGEYLGVEPDISSNIYRFKFMRPDGKVVWCDVDGRTARIVGMH